MKKSIDKLRALIFLSAAVACFIWHDAEAADRMLGFNEKTQEHDQWCWAGTSQSALEYYDTFVSQCAIANWAFGRSDCCGNTDFYWSYTACNYWNYMYGGSSQGSNPDGSLQGILSHWGVASNALATYLSQPTCVSEINNNRPFVMRFGWTGGGGHFLDGFGYDNDGQYLHYMDPWPGNGYTLSLYTWVVSASDHAWTHTLQLTTTPAACIYAFAYPYNSNTQAYGPWSDTIQAAYNAVTTEDIIFSRAKGTIENINLNRSIPIKLYGGVNCDYSLYTGFTRVSGSLTIGRYSGPVEIKHYIIQP